MRDASETFAADESPQVVAKAIERRRRAVEAPWHAFDAVVVIGAGAPIPIPGRADIAKVEAEQHVRESTEETKPTFGMRKGRAAGERKP